MLHHTKTSKTTILVLTLCLVTAGSAAAAGGVSIDSSLISWDAAPGYELTLTVSGHGQDYRYELGAGEAATFSIFDEAGQLLADGNYAWQLSAAPVLSVQEAAVMREARAAGVSLSDKTVGGYTESGYFTVAGGAFVTPSALEDGAAKAQVIADDLIVDGSACIGIDCTSSESFGFDTLRLKENNLRIKFDDTSGSASFPNNDWQLTANDSTNGGANKFSIDDITNGKTPFTVEAGAPNNALYVASEGRLGVNTSTPVVDIHAVNGNTPTLRLEQDGSSGFTAQTWDVAGNETNFFIRDVTNGSKLPFRIKPGAPDDSIYVDSNGNIGLGTASPTDAVHVENTGGQDTDDFVVTSSGRVGVGTTSPSESIHIVTAAQNSGRMRFNDGNQWDVGSGSGDTFIINDNNGDAAEMTLFANGNVTITGTLTSGGPTCGGGCDRVFAADYELPTIEEHAAEMWEKGYLPQVGPTLPKAPINLSEKTGDMLNELEKAHIYIEQLNDRLKEGLEEKDERIRQLETALAELRALVAAQ